MKHALPSLDALKVFESAARHLSFSKAADELCLSRAAVSYRIRQFEKNLDCALFRRSVRQVYLTDAGQHLLRQTRRWFAEMHETLAQIQPAESRHDVLVGATTYVALRWLSPRIARFNEAHPDVSILLQHAVNAEDFRLQDVDLAIRWDRLGSAATRATLLEMPMPLFPVCSPRLLERLGYPSNARSLASGALASPPMDASILLCEDRPLDLWRDWCGDRQPTLANPRRVIADANVRSQAAVDGQGWTLADAMMTPEIGQGLLVAPFAHRLDGYGYLLQSAPGRFLGRGARRLRDWLVEYADVADAST